MVVKKIRNQRRGEKQREGERQRKIERERGSSVSFVFCITDVVIWAGWGINVSKSSFWANLQSYLGPPFRNSFGSIHMLQREKLETQSLRLKQNM